MEPLKRLEIWFAEQCNGEWEHSAGISIDTLDNPGWAVRVNIADTVLSRRPFKALRDDGIDPKDWYLCRVKDGQFEAFCSPSHLAKVLEFFLDWAEATGTKR